MSSASSSNTSEFWRDDRVVIDCLTELDSEDWLDVITDLHRFHLELLFINPREDPPVWVVRATGGLFVAGTPLHLLGSHAQYIPKGQKVDPADVITNKLVGGMRVVVQDLRLRERALWLIGPVREIGVGHA